MHDHRDLMVSLAVEHDWRRGVELGLGRGLLFRRLLALGLEMVGVDMGLRPDRKAVVDELAAQPNARVLWLPSVEAVAHVEDGWADFVFIDAGHSYEAVKADIAVWQPKVKTGGWFGGHDYHFSHPGVIRAVEEAFPNRRLLDHWIWARA